MKKTYNTPRIRVFNIASEGLVAQSGGAKIGFDPNAPATHSAYPEDDVLSNRRGGSIWDED